MESQIEVRESGGMSFVGKDAVEVYAATVLESALRTFAKHGLRMNRAYTPTAMMKRAAQITGKTFKARDYVGAADALKAWRSESTVPVVHVPTNHHKPSCVSGRGEWSGSPSQKPPYNAWICDECGASIPCEDGPVIVICKSRYDRWNYCPLDAIRTLGKVMEYDTEGFESYDDALAAAKRDGSIPSNAQFKAVTDWSGRP